MKIGVIGLGTVGYGVIEILTNERKRLEKVINDEVMIKYGCGLEEVDLPEGVIYTKDFNDVINDHEIDVVVELIGGNSYMSLPIKSVGFPYTVSFDIKPDGVMEPGTVLFEGKDGILYGALENGNIGYTREGQTYHYGTALETDKWSNLTIVCDKKDTTLYIDGKKVSVASNIKKVSRNSSTTFYHRQL